MGNSLVNKSKMKIKNVLFFTLLFAFAACNTKKENKNTTDSVQKETAKQVFEFGVWITSEKDKTIGAYHAEFKKYKASGIDEILINTLTDPIELERLVPIAKKEGLKVHAWIMTMNRPGDQLLCNTQNGIWLARKESRVLIHVLM